MIADGVVGAESVCLFIDLIAQETNKLLLIRIVIGDKGAISFSDAPILVLLRSKFYLGHEAVPPVVRVFDSRDVVVVVEVPLVALSTFSSMLLKM